MGYNVGETAFTLDYFERLVANSAEENIHRDFKACDSLSFERRGDKKKSEFAKDVSAFANSDGGVLLYGIKEVRRDDDECIELGEGTSRVTKEQLENILTNRINPKIEGLLIHEVPNSNGTSYWAVEVPRSLDGPHQSGHKFFKRHNFSSYPMESYEIEDVRRRRLFEAPELSIDFAYDGRYGDSWEVCVRNLSQVSIFDLELSILSGSWWGDIEAPGVFECGAARVAPGKEYYYTILDHHIENRNSTMRIEATYKGPDRSTLFKDNFDLNLREGYSAISDASRQQDYSRPLESIARELRDLNAALRVNSRSTMDRMLSGGTIGSVLHDIFGLLKTGGVPQLPTNTPATERDSEESE
jgi:hypothetical protein